MTCADWLILQEKALDSTSSGYVNKQNFKDAIFILSKQNRIQAPPELLKEGQEDGEFQ